MDEHGGAIVGQLAGEGAPEPIGGAGDEDRVVAERGQGLRS
jgi:hypothetical protein